MMRSLPRFVLALTVALACLSVAVGPRPIAAQEATPVTALVATPQQAPPAPLTVVLVHGAWSGASTWAGVISVLHEAGVNVVAAANPLRGLSADAAYIASMVRQIPGPVLLVGHSYGGAVITNAAAQA